MKILFIGGTGRLSKDVAQLASDLDNEVYIFTRGSKSRSSFVSEKYTCIYGNIRNVDESKNTLSSYYFDVVIDFLSYNCQQLMDTLNILENKYSQFIFISTATVYNRDNYDELISEEKTPVGNDKWDYAYNKFLCEEYLNTYFKNRKENYTIIRPGVTYGNTRIPYPIVPGNTQKEYSFLYRIKINDPIPVFDNGDTEITLTHTRDFAKGVLSLMGNESAFGEAFHITTSSTTTWGTVLDYLEKIMCTTIFRLQLTQKQIYDEIPYYKDILLGDKGNTTKYDNSKICSVSENLTFDTDLYEGLLEMVQFYESHPEFQQIDYFWMGSIDRLVKKNHKKIASISFSEKSDRIAYLRGRYKLFDKLVRLIKGK